jgi:hypothetical protein
MRPSAALPWASSVPKLVFDKGGDVNRLDQGEIHNAMLSTEGRELPHRLQVSAAGIGIANVRAKEIAHPTTHRRVNHEDRGQGSDA